MLDCGINGAYTIGGGTMLKMKQESETVLPNIDEYPQRKIYWNRNSSISHRTK